MPSYLSPENVAKLLLGHDQSGEQNSDINTEKLFWDTQPAQMVGIVSEENALWKANSHFANETKKLYFQKGTSAVFLIWHSALDVTEIIAFNQDGTSMLKLRENLFHICDLIFLEDDKPLLVAEYLQPQRKNRSALVQCDLDFSIKWKCDFDTERIYSISLCQEWNCILCVTQSICRGYRYKSLYKIAMNGDLLWKKEFPLEVSSGELSLKTTDKYLIVYYGNEQVVISTDGILLQKTTYDNLIHKVFMLSEFTYLLASPIKKKTPIKKQPGSIISCFDKKSLYLVEPDGRLCEIFASDDMDICWIINKHIFLTTHPWGNKRNLQCYTLNGSLVWETGISSSLSCPPLYIGDDLYAICTESNYISAQDTLNIQQFIVASNGSILDESSLRSSQLPIRDICIHDNGIWCLRSGMAENGSENEQYAQGEWQLEKLKGFSFN